MRATRGLIVLACCLPAIAYAGGGGGDHDVIRNIALCMVSAGLFGLLVRWLRQPLILGYILAGIAIGPIGLGLITDQAEISTIAEIGLILLLFMIGLEIDLRKMASAGRLVIVTGIVQLPICVGLGLLIFTGVSRAGIRLGGGDYAVLYLAIAIGISSTMIVVKLLYDKFELDTLPGRISIGLLVFQDIWAIVILAIQPDLADPQVFSILGTFAKGGLVVVGAFLCSRYVLPAMFRSVAKLPELMLVLSLGWCFLVCLVAAHPTVGLSMEMGALIAGVSLATFPYNLDVIGKVISIRDFFITLFFVALAMQIPVPNLDVLTVALLVGVAVVLVRVFGIFGVLYAMRGGHRTSLLTMINLSQMSEFSLVILSLGVSFGHIERDVLTNAIWAFSILAVASTYLVAYSHGLQQGISRVLTTIGLKDLAQTQVDEAQTESPPVVLLGFFRVASALVDTVRQQNEALLAKIQVVDFNPQVATRLRDLGVNAIYGDVSHPDTLHHAGIHHARAIVCTVPDSVLKGTTNSNLLEVLKRMCPDGDIIVTAESPEQARVLYEAGAAYVIQVNQLAGHEVAEAIESSLRGALAGSRDDALLRLQTSTDLI